MCGIVGFFGLRGVRAEDVSLEKALHQMRRRGPDGEGTWHEGPCCLGHRRLSIIDLDPRAGQPMLSACGRYVIAFNGEIYNYAELRRKLQDEGAVFRTSSDTEVLLELFARRGADALPQLRGMFAFVIWDRRERRAFVARDPYGIKPLYVARTSSGLLVGSQVRALMATGLVSDQPCIRGQSGFWMLGSVPEPFTWFAEVEALRAGHYAWIEDGKISMAKCWWDVTEEWRTADGPQGPELVRERVRDALTRTVAAHRVADVPVGVFLSGGVDSSALAALMAEGGAKDLQGVTITYNEFAHTANDEVPGAAMIAQRYGLRHHIRKVGREEFEADLSRIVAAMDQPSIDGVNTWYASKAMAEIGIKVAVSGVGGDELFQGYPSFQSLPKLVSFWRRFSRVPGMKPLAKVASRLQAWRTGNSRWLHAPEWAGSIGGAWWLRRSLFSPEDLLAVMGGDYATSALKPHDVSEWIRSFDARLPNDPRLALGALESITYLRNQLLRDSDWASMDHSIELRTPFVDAWLLRELRPLLGSFERYPNKRLIAGAPATPLPEALITRTKTGFGIPIQSWVDLPLYKKGSTHSQSWAIRVADEYAV